MCVNFIYDNLGLYLATNNLKAHLRTLCVVDILIQDLEFNCIFDIEVRKDDGDRIAGGKLFADALESRAHCLPLSIYRLSIIILELLLCAYHLIRYHQGLHLLNS